MSQESKKQTAVEWLAEKYNYLAWMRSRDEISAGLAVEWLNNFFDKAKEMEKEQQKDAWVDGNNTEICRRSIDVDECFNYYYAEVYGKE